jgi:hypothetical protein
VYTACIFYAYVYTYDARGVLEELQKRCAGVSANVLQDLRGDGICNGMRTCGHANMNESSDEQSEAAGEGLSSSGHGILHNRGSG